MVTKDWREYLAQPQTSERDYTLPITAWDRNPEDPCQKGTVGCSVDHAASHWDHGCETW